MSRGECRTLPSIRAGDVCRNEKDGDTPSQASSFSHTPNGDEGSISLEGFWGDSGRDAQHLASPRQGADGMIFIQEGTNVTGLALGLEAAPKYVQSPLLGRGPWMKHCCPKPGPRLAPHEPPAMPRDCHGESTQHMAPGLIRASSDIANMCRSLRRGCPLWSAGGWEADWCMQPTGLRHTGVQIPLCPLSPSDLSKSLTPRPRKLDFGVTPALEGRLVVQGGCFF